MIKEFEKLLGIVDVNINLQKHAEGVYARVIFIPLKANPMELKPQEAWGTMPEVENFIRFALQGFADNIARVEKEIGEPIPYTPPKKEEKKKPKKTVEEIKKERDTVVNPPDEIASRPLTEAECEVEQGCPFDEQLEEAKVDCQDKIDDAKAELEEIVKESGVPKDNIVIAKPKPLPEKKKAPSGLNLTFANGETKEIKRCKKCELPIKDDMSQCIYGDECPQKEDAEKFPIEAHTEKNFLGIKGEFGGPNTKPLTPEENKLRNAMIEDEEKWPTLEQPEPLTATREQVQEAVDNNPNFNPENPEAGLYNSRDLEGENDEPEISEADQMMIDEANKKLNEANNWQAPTFNF